MFRVNPEAMRAAAKRFAASAAHLRIAADYHRAPSQLDFYEKGLILSMKSTHDVFIARLQDRLDAAARHLNLSATEIDRAAIAYTTTDSDSARLFDSAIQAPVSG